MSRGELLDLYFMDARSKLIDLAAFLDRLDRAEGEADFRLAAFWKRSSDWAATSPCAPAEVLLAFSDPTTEPIADAPGKGAVRRVAGQSVLSR